MEKDIFDNIYHLIRKYKQEPTDYRKQYINQMIDELKSIKEKEC
jgi:hypothetical protein